jgi:predicted GIY-YIG superfamily endonuclease
MIFVGTKEETTQALADLLQIRSQYSDYICYVLNQLTCCQNYPTIIDQVKMHPFRPVDVQLPTNISGYVYILVSLQDHSSTYIGETHDIRKRLQQHNSGNGAKVTAQQLLRPWALLGYVCGFEENKLLRRQFEASWKARRDYMDTMQSRALTPVECARCAYEVMKYHKFNHLDLRYIKCGEI